MGSEPRIRALVLAAGLGQRLCPLTGLLPKPLLPVLGRPLIGHTLEVLSRSGCEAAAINLHHLGDRIETVLGDSQYGLKLVYSREETLLGTLGALHPLRSFFREADLIVVINGDSLCRWPLRRLIRGHLRSGASATLLLSTRADPDRFGGGVRLSEAGRIERLRGVTAASSAEPFRRRVFAGAQVLDATLLRRFGEEERAADLISDLYQPLLDEGEHLFGLESSLQWHDLGTPQRYLEGVGDWARGRAPGRWLRRSWVARSARLGPGVRMRRSVLEEGTTIGPRATVRHSLIMTGARVGPGSVLDRVIVAPGVEIGSGSRLSGRLVTPLQAGRHPGAVDSVVGQLVYTPL